MDEEFHINENKLSILVIGMAGTGKTTFVDVHNNIYIVIKQITK